MLRLTTILTAACLLAALAVSQQRGAEAASEGARRSRCPVERELEMDVCASRMGFLGDHSFRVPKNMTAASGFCGQLRDSISCIQNYARDCLQGFTRQILMSLLKRGKQQFSSVCSDARSRQSMMDKLACLADNRVEQLHRCMDGSVARFEFIASDQVKPDIRLQGLCCSYQIFNREVDSALERVCGRPRALAGSAHEFVHRVFGGTTGEFFQLICDGHRSLDECRQSRSTSELLARLEEVTRLVAAGKLRPRKKSVVPVLLEILDSSAQ